MKKRKTNILKILAASGLIYFLFVRARRAPRNNFETMPINDENIKAAFKQIFDEYGRAKTEKLEQLFRKETRHFESGQFKGTLSPGMEPSPNTNRTFPYGWTSLKKFADENNIPYEKFFVKGPYTEGGTGRQKYFIGFPNVYAAMKFVMYVIEKRGWNFGKWRAFDETIANNYNASLNTIIPRITRTF